MSPHCDDAVLSVGALLAAHVRTGGQALVLTVLAGVPASSAPAGAWDAAAGFTSEGRAAQHRRAEDTAACTLLGTRWVHVDEADEQYARRRSDEALWDRLHPHLEQADEVLLPGFPLRQADHARTAALVLRHLPAERLVRLYVEQPYGLRERRPREREVVLGHRHVRWQRPVVGPQDMLRKARAVRRYGSQLPLLGPGRLPSPSAVASRVVQAQLFAAACRGGEQVSAPIAAGALLVPARL